VCTAPYLLTHCRIAPLPPQPELDAGFHPKRKPTAEQLEALAACANTSTAAAGEYLRRKRALLTQRTAVWKFAEAAWRALLYSAVVIFGAWATVGQPWFTEPFVYCWKGWPAQQLPQSSYQYYALGMGIYTHLLMFQVRCCTATVHLHTARLQHTASAAAVGTLVTLQCWDTR
jgi:hypothetical protein